MTAHEVSPKLLESADWFYINGGKRWSARESNRSSRKGPMEPDLIRHRSSDSLRTWMRDYR